MRLQANFFRLLKQPTWNIYKYDIKFEPECMMMGLRNALIMQHKDEIGGYLFDGTQLFLTRKLKTDDNDTIVYRSESREKVEYTLTAKFTRIVQMTENESLQILNLILRRATHGLDLKLVGRNFYDPSAKVRNLFESIRIFCIENFSSSKLEYFSTKMIIKNKCLYFAIDRIGTIQDGIVAGIHNICAQT